MKKLILIPLLSSASFAVFAQKDTTKLQTAPVQYCAELRDGMIVVLADQKIITSDVITSEGTRIKTNGSIVKKDGDSTVLKDGECIDAQGVLVNLTTENDKKKKNETLFSGREK